MIHSLRFSMPTHIGASALLIGLSALTACSGATDSEVSTEESIAGEYTGQVSQALVSSPKKMAYYPAWASATSPEPPSALPWSNMTHVIVSFLGISPKTSAFGNKYQCRFWTDYNMQDMEDTTALSNAQALINYRNQHHPDVKVLVAVGGWSLSYRFSNALNTATDRSDLADSCVNLINSMGFDGLDIDWEYPTRLGPTSGSGSCRTGWTCQRSTDAANLTAWLDALRSKPGFSGKLLTMAVRANRSGDPQNIPYEYGNFFANGRLNLLNVMTYDFHGSWESTTNYGAPYAKMTEAANYVISQVGSVNKDKVVVGIPFYGPRWTNVASSGVGASGGMGAEPLTYRAARTNYFGMSGCGVYGSTSDRNIWCSGTTNGDYRPWISYDDPTVVGTKAQWIADNNFGGAMWWAAGQDYNNELANAIGAKLPGGGGGSGVSTTWTGWYNRDDAGGSGDYENRELQAGVCANPIAFEARVVGTSTMYHSAGERVVASATGGLQCQNSAQSDGTCNNYEIRFLCPSSWPVAGSWTGWYDSDDPAGSGDYENGGVPCAKSWAIEAQTTSGVDWTATGDFVRIEPNYGFHCQNALQPDGSCNDYRVRYFCAN